MADEHILSAQNLAAAQAEYGGGGAVHGNGHHGHHQDDAHVGPQGGGGEIIVGAFEFGLFIALTHKGLDHPDGHQIFLNGAVEGVDPGLHDLEQVVTGLHQKTDGQGHQRDDHQHHHGKLRVDADRHEEGGDEHHRGPGEHAQSHGHHHSWMALTSLVMRVMREAEEKRSMSEKENSCTLL